MAFTDAIVTVVGEPTKSSTANALAANTEFNRDYADIEHNFDISTATGKHKDIIATTAGATTKIQIDNTATDGDPILAFALSGTDKFTMGVDDGDNDLFKIGTTAIGTSTWLQASATGLTALTTAAGATITATTGGAFNIALSSAAGDDFIVDTDKLVVEGDTGFVGIGTTGPVAKLDVHYTPSDASGNAIEVDIVPSWTTAGTYYDHGITINSEQSSTAGQKNSGYQRGAYVTVFGGAGNLADLTGLGSSWGTYTGDSGTIDNAYGLRLIPYYMAGTISNMYGVKIDDSATGGTVTNKWAIYNDWDAPSYFKGTVGIGTTAPDKKIEINTGASDNGIRLTYNDADGSATDYCDFMVGADGDLTITTVDSDGVAGHITLVSDGSVIIGNAAINTNATDGFLYIPSCAGTPTGTPTTKTGRIPIVYDSTNDILYVYNSGWKAVVTGEVF